MYPMRFCPWCGRAQTWRYDHFENACPHCDRGVDDWMATCPWCGEDATVATSSRERCGARAGC